MSEGERWLTRLEAAQVSQSTTGWIERLGKSGKIKRQKDGASYRYAHSDVAEILKRRKERGYKSGPGGSSSTKTKTAAKTVSKNGTHAKGPWLPLHAAAARLGVASNYMGKMVVQKPELRAFRRGEPGAFVYDIRGFAKWRAKHGRGTGGKLGNKRDKVKNNKIKSDKVKNDRQMSSHDVRKPVGWKKMAASATERLRRARFTIEALDMKVMSTDEVLAKLRTILFDDAINGVEE